MPVETPPHQHYSGGVLGGRICTGSCWGQIVVDPDSEATYQLPDEQWWRCESCGIRGIVDWNWSTGPSVHFGCGGSLALEEA